MNIETETTRPPDEDPVPDTGSGEALTTETATNPDQESNKPEVPVKADEVKTATTPAEETEEDGMSFIDHLEEIRWRLVKGGIALLAMTALCAIKADFLVEQVLIAPLKNSGPEIVLQNLVPYGQISLYLQTVFFSGFILSFPFIVYQVWKFVEPGLQEEERKASRFVILFISLCFFTGIAFGYFVFLPISLTFFAGFGSELIRNNIAIQDYIGFFLGALLTAGIVFELPFVSYILSKIGLLTPAFMRFYRKHAIIAMLVIAAIVTPSTDMVTQLVIAGPMVLLYELSIFISADVQRKRNRREIEAAAKA